MRGCLAAKTSLFVRDWYPNFLSLLVVWIKSQLKDSQHSLNLSKVHIISHDNGGQWKFLQILCYDLMIIMMVLEIIILIIEMKILDHKS
jgi:hypothetical protein